MSEGFTGLGFIEKKAPSYTLHEGHIGDCPWKFSVYVPKEHMTDKFSNLLAQFEKTFKVVTELGVFNVSKSLGSLEISDLKLGDPGVNSMFPETNKQSVDNDPLALDFNQITKEISKPNTFLNRKINTLNMSAVNNYYLTIFETDGEAPQKFVLVNGRHDDTYGVELDTETLREIHKLVSPYFKKIFGEDIPELALGLIIGDEEV